MTAPLDVPDQTVRFVLCGYADAANARVHAVGQREVNDAELAAERNGGLRAPVGEILESAAAPAGEDEPVSVFSDDADEAHIGIERWARFGRYRFGCHGFESIFRCWASIQLGSQAEVFL